MQTPVLGNAATDLGRPTPARNHVGGSARHAQAVCAPSAEGRALRLRDAHGRLPRLLGMLQQAEACLCVRQVVRLARQPAQVVIQVLSTTPPSGATPALRCHTFEVESDAPPMVVGQYIRMRRDGPLGVRLELLPTPPT